MLVRCRGEQQADLRRRHGRPVEPSPGANRTRGHRTWRRRTRSRSRRRTRTCPLWARSDGPRERVLAEHKAPRPGFRARPWVWRPARPPRISVCKKAAPEARPIGSTLAPCA